MQTDADLLQQIVAEIGANRPAIQRRNPQVKTTESRPRRYYWSVKSNNEEIDEADARPVPVSQADIADDGPLREHALYPILQDFLSSELNVGSMRIDEHKSSNRRGINGNKWLYPDLAGMEDLTRDWKSEVRLCISQTGAPRAKLWSLEVKRLLNRANVREAYFQAVSNSSWANVGYLVTAEVEGTDTVGELRMLYALHGIGVIQLDVANPAESQILIPARERPAVDWSTCNRLFDENEDFKIYIKRVRQFHQTGDRPAEW